MAKRMGLDRKKGKLIYSQVGDGGFIPIYLPGYPIRA